MESRLSRAFDWLFHGSHREAGGSIFRARQAVRARPRPEDRAHYDSGTAFFGN